jgi:hypothetical protein
LIAYVCPRFSTFTIAETITKALATTFATPLTATTVTTPLTATVTTE